MGLALVLAEQYVRESQDKEDEKDEDGCDGFSVIEWRSHIATPTCSPNLSEHKESGLLETTEQRQAFLALPMHSTRSRDVKMRTVSSGSTACEPMDGPLPLPPKDRRRRGGRARLLSRPVKWIRGFVGSLK
ncbi:hypothetical protein IWW47_000003 [Coemansia sp. RSA 2052]|nr:hypothetical protein IWW47_000003 [Coemansia sp. RSA 2052]